jgi:dTDP-4-dehydrorhamnose reductase
MSRVLVLGRNGQVARALADAGWPEGISLSCYGRDEIDLAEPATVARAIVRRAPDLVINAAAYTAVDRAESEPEAAFAVNRDGAGEVAKACADLGVPLIHLSTDYVFDGSKTGAYVEEDPVNPLSVYGASKEAGEQAVRAALPAHLIMRSAWIYAPQGQNFVLTMLRLAREGAEIRVVDDQIGCPSAAFDIARAIVVASGRLLTGSGAFGTFHFCGTSSTNWHEFAQAIFELAEVPQPKLTAVATSARPTPARRPANSTLDGAKFRRLYGLSGRPWRESLGRCLREIAAREAATA